MTLFGKKTAAILMCLTILAVPSQFVWAKSDAATVKSTNPSKSGAKIDDVQQFQKQAEDIKKDLEAERARQEELKQKQQALAAEIEKLQRDMVDTAKSAQEQEEALNKLDESLGDLGKQKDKATKSLLKNHDSLSQILASLLRFKRQPPQALMIIPQTPIDIAHSVMLLKTMVPELQTKADELKAQLDEITKLENSIADKRDEVEQRTAQLRNERNKIAGLVKRRSAAQIANAKEQEKLESRIADLAGKAADMNDLIAKLEAERKAREAKPKFKPKSPPKEIAALAGLPLPAKGKLLVGYGEKNDLGVASKGLTIETRSGAQVTSPLKGEIVYAGQFRSYGLILIIEVADGYHIMLSNLGRVDCVLGQEVLAGEPIGIMSESGETAPRLYVEYRKGGQPVSPQMWTGSMS